MKPVQHEHFLFLEVDELLFYQLGLFLLLIEHAFYQWQQMHNIGDLGLENWINITVDCTYSF